jgi:hypothetical protein
MQEIYASGFPQLAPLSTPFVKHLLRYQEMLRNTHTFKTIAPAERVDEMATLVYENWSQFVQCVQAKRHEAYLLLLSGVRVSGSSHYSFVESGWLRSIVSSLLPASHQGKKDAITAQTLSSWSEKRLLRRRAWGQLEVQSVASILTARLMDETRARSWLPGAIAADEPHWWCYRQAAPVNGVPSPIEPCPIPFPALLPPSTLLWTPWVGASLDPCWLQVDSVGAIRWAGATLDAQGMVRWNVSEEDLRRWNPDLSLSDAQKLRFAPETLNATAHFTLLSLAARCFPQKMAMA